MNIIIDTNIVFSTLLKNENKFVDIILKNIGIFEFYSSNFLKEEISIHLEKIIKLSGLSINEIEEKINLIYSNINFVDEDFINYSTIKTAFYLVKDIDVKDVLYVALSLDFDAKLWTGDKKLVNGLATKGFNNFISTDELYLIMISNNN